MENKLSELLKLEKAVQFLENVEKDKLREKALSSIKKAGIDDISLVKIESSGMFHTDSNLSPAAGIAIAPNGKLFLSDEFNHRISAYAPNGKLEKVFGSKGSGDGEFHYPRGIAIDDSGKLYIADAWNHRIVVLEPDLTFNKSFGKLGSGVGELDEPVDICIWNDLLAVIEKSNHRIQFFEIDGTPVGTLGTRGSVLEQEAFYISNWRDGTFSTPVFEFPSAITTDAKNSLYIADTNNHRLVKLDHNLSVVSWYHLSGIKFPSGITSDSSGDIHLTQFNRKKINVYSPEGIHLYSYEAGMEVPLYAVANGKSIYLANGIKPGILKLTISSKHSRSICLEESFSFYLKTAIAEIEKGNWDKAGESLKAAMESPSKPSISELANLLPETDFSFTKPDGEYDKKIFEPFTAFLSSQAAKVLEEIEAELTEKISIGDDLTKTALELEKALLANAPSVDELMVSKYRANKKLFAKSVSIKGKLASFKKIEELSRRFAFYGININERLDRIEENIRFALRVSAKAIDYFSAAEKEAPTLNFNSSPDQRKVFLQNYNRHNLVTAELQAFSNFTAELNCELAGISKSLDDEDKEKFNSIIIISVEAFSTIPKSLEENSIYLKSLELLFDTIGTEWASTILSKVSTETLWSKLGKEENIKHGEGSAYQLLPALWTDNPVENIELKAKSWGKIRDFYHNEFNRFPKEVEPILTEQLRLMQQLPIAQKSDHLQAAQIEAKINLLSFHQVFQERYICNMAREYLLRYALFSLAKAAVPQDEIENTKKQLEKLAETYVSNFFTMMREATAAWSYASNSKDPEEKKRLKIKNQYLDLSARFHHCLGFFFKIAKGNLHSEARLKPTATFHRPLEVSKPLTPPIAVSITGNEVLVLYHENPNLITLDLDGKLLSRRIKYGKIPKTFLKGLDLKNMGNSDFLLSHLEPSGLIKISTGGESTSRIPIQIEDGRIPFRVDVGKDGNFYVSFLDGRGLSIFDSNGNLIRELGTDKFAGIDKVWGFLLTEDEIITGGNGKFVSINLQGNEKKSFALPDEDFTIISSITNDENGNIFAVAMENNKLLRLTSSLDKVERIKINSHGLVAVAVEKGYLILADYADGAVRIFKTGSD